MPKLCKENIINVLEEPSTKHSPVEIAPEVVDLDLVKEEGNICSTEQTDLECVPSQVSASDTSSAEKDITHEKNSCVKSIQEVEDRTKSSDTRIAIQSFLEVDDEVRHLLPKTLDERDSQSANTQTTADTNELKTKAEAHPNVDEITIGNESSIGYTSMQTYSDEGNRELWNR